MSDEIKVCAVPHIENLRVRDLIEFIETECSFGLAYIPDDYNKRSLNRPWLFNLCERFILIYYLGNTFDEEKFSKLIVDAIKSRQDYIVQNNSLEIALNNRIAQSLMNSSFVSSKINN